MSRDKIWASDLVKVDHCTLIILAWEPQAKLSSARPPHAQLLFVLRNRVCESSERQISKLSNRPKCMLRKGNVRRGPGVILRSSGVGYSVFGFMSGINIQHSMIISFPQLN